MPAGIVRGCPYDAFRAAVRFPRWGPPAGPSRWGQDPAWPPRAASNRVDRRHRVPVIDPAVEPAPRVGHADARGRGGLWWRRPPSRPGERLVREIVVFSGSAHRALATAICDELGVELSSVEMTRFSNDCLQAQLQANCRQRDVYIVQPLVPPTQEHLMELLLMVDAAKGASAAQVTAVIPHYAYARSDKKDASRISIGGRLVADLLATAGVSRVITMTLHAPAGARVLLRAGGPPHRARRAGRALPGPGSQGHGRGLARPRQRQDRDPVRPPARRAGRGREQAAARRRPGRDRRDRRRRGGQARADPRRRDRHGRVHRRAPRQAGRARLHRRLRGLHARAVRGQGRLPAARSTR